MTERSNGQDLDPRAYARIPVNVTVVVAGFSYSTGGIVTDATLPLEDLNAKIGAPSLGVVRSFESVWKDSPGICCTALCLGRCVGNYIWCSAKHNSLRFQRHETQVLMVISRGASCYNWRDRKSDHERQYLVPVSVL